jgi:nucleoside-diphosphate-sugar epimerase
MKVLITGGNGYIAKSLYEGLKDEHDITCISRTDFDLTDYNQTFRWFENKHFDVVIHAAAVGGTRLMVDDESVVNRNLQMYYNLVALEDQFDRFITFGSGAEVTMPWEPYGFSKRIIAESMKKRGKYYNLRIRAVFDENELDTRFIKGNLLRYINHEPMVIHQNKYMDFFYMKDLVSLVGFYITEKDPILQEVDCCYNYSLTLSEIANHINSLGDHRVEVKVQTDGMATAYTGQYRPVLTSLIGLVDGIHKTYLKLKT